MTPTDPRFKELKQNLTDLAEQHDVGDREGSPYKTLRSNMIFYDWLNSPQPAHDSYSPILKDQVEQLRAAGLGDSDEEVAFFIRAMIIEHTSEDSRRERDGAKRLAHIEDAIADVFGREDIREVADLSTEMPFGKYSGKTLAEIIDEDPGYAKWAARELDDKPALRRAFADNL